MPKSRQKDTKSALKIGVFALLTGTLLCLLPSCLENKSSSHRYSFIDSDEELEDSNIEISFLRSRIEWLEKDLEQQREDYWGLLEKISLLEIKDECKSTAIFCASEGINDGFQVIETSSGHFLISLKEVTPYLSGYKLIFSLGNPSLATYDNAKLRVSWNRSYQSWKDDKEYATLMAEYEKSYEEYLLKLSTKNSSGEIKKPERPKRPFWSEEKKEKEFTLKTQLNPGAWNSVEVHVTPATLKQLDFIEVKIEAPTVSLSKSK